MSATGNEVVTLRQLKEAINQSSQSGIVMAIKPLYRDDNIDNLHNLSDTGIYYRAEGGSYSGTWPWSGSSAMCLEIYPLMSDFNDGVWRMVQRCTSLGGSLATRTMQSDGRWSVWYKFTGGA